MGIKDDLEKQVRQVFKEMWKERDGTVIPDDTSITLGNDGVNLDGTVLYADLSESTKMVDKKTAKFSAEIYKTFLLCAARIIRHQGGSVTAYDGDRIMAVFIGERKNTRAAKAALQLNWACKRLIQPLKDETYPKSDFTINHTVGIDTSKLLVAKTGVRGANDLVWVGRAANWAAKLTTLPHDTPTWITKAVYDVLADDAKLSSGKNMWEQRTWTAMNNEIIYGSVWASVL